MWCCNKCIDKRLYANKNVEECKMKEVVKVSETIKEIPGFSRYLADISKGHTKH